MSNSTTKIALIADTHYGAVKEGRGRKCSEFAAEFLRDFAQEVKDFDFGVELGDLIQDAGPEFARGNMLTALSLIDQNVSPLYHLIGNHDSRHIPLEELRQLLGLDSLSYFVDHSAFRFIFLHNTVVDLVSHAACVTRHDLAWLERSLNTSRSCIIFSHYPLADQDLSGNTWFADRPRSCLLSNRREVREIINSSGQVLAAINGHAHWNNITQHNDIPYISIQSAVEGIGENFLPANARAHLSVSKDELCLKVFGREPMIFLKRIDSKGTLFSGHSEL